MLVQRGTPKPATCHPEKKAEAHGLCKTCYNLWWRKQNPERTRASRKREHEKERETPEKLAALRERERERYKRRREEAPLRPPNTRKKGTHKQRAQAECHPDRPQKARGLCKPCYKRWWRQNNPELHAASKARWKQRIGPSEFNYRKKYGIGLADRDAMLAAQGGKCAICGQRPATNTDHCHKSGKVRAMLCSGCNGGLGLFRDNPAFMRAAIKYLWRHSEENHLHTGIHEIHLCQVA